MATKVNANRRPVASEPPDAAVIAGMVRQLVAQADHAAPQVRKVEADHSALDHRRVLLDSEVDGVRCILVRVDQPAAPPIALSPRECEIARMVAKGFPNKMIASVLDISSWTVGTYLRRMFAKAGVNSRAALVARLVSAHALRDGEAEKPVAETRPSPARPGHSRPRP